MNQTNLLSGLWYRLSQLALPIMAALQPGLKDQEIDLLLHDFPFKVPVEVRSYFQWQNGLRNDAAASAWLFHGGDIMPLEMVVELYKMQLQITEEIVGKIDGQSYQQLEVTTDPHFILDSPLSGWDPKWLPIFGDGAGGYYVVICDKVAQPIAPIYYVFSQSDEIYLAFDSLTSLLLTTAAAFESGAYFLNEVGYVLEDRAKLAPIINHYNPHRRQYFLRAAQANSMPEVVANLAHPDPDVRKNAFQAVRYLYEPDTVPLLIQALQQPTPQARRYAAELLSEQQDPQAADALLAALQDGDAEVREFAAIALGYLPDLRAVDALIPLLNDAVGKVRQRAASALGSLGEPRAIPHLVEHLNDPDKDARRFVELAIEELERKR